MSLILKNIREAYDGFLGDFPFSLKHWQKYAEHEKSLCSSQRVMEVYERAVAAIPTSVDIWCSYCHFAISAYGEQSIIRRLFERALRYVGNSYYSARLWDLYLEYEDMQKAWHNVATIYTRILGSPKEDLDWYYSCFKEFASVHAHVLHEMLTPDDVNQFKTISLAHEKITGAPLSEANGFDWYISIRQDAYEKAKANGPSVIKEANAPKLSILFQPPCQPWNGSKFMVTLSLPEFLRLNIHIKEVKFQTVNNGTTVNTPIGRRLLKAIFQAITLQYADGFCWAGVLRPEDILVHFDGSQESDVIAVIQKHATVPINIEPIIADSDSLENMLRVPFTLNGNSVPYMSALFHKELREPPADVATNAQTRNAWLETVCLHPLFSFLSSRIRLFRHLHKLLKNGSSSDKAQFNSEFATFVKPNTLGLTVSQHPILAEVYWFPKEKNKKKMQKVERKPAKLIMEVLSYNVAQLVILIRHFDSHARDTFKDLGVNTDDFEETEHMVDFYFDFLLPALIRGLQKIAIVNPKVSKRQRAREKKIGDCCNRWCLALHMFKITLVQT